MMTTTATVPSILLPDAKRCPRCLIRHAGLSTCRKAIEAKSAAAGEYVPGASESYLASLAALWARING